MDGQSFTDTIARSLYRFGLSCWASRLQIFSRGQSPFQSLSPGSTCSGLYTTASLRRWGSRRLHSLPPPSFGNEVWQVPVCQVATPVLLGLRGTGCFSVFGVGGWGWGGVITYIGSASRLSYRFRLTHSHKQAWQVPSRACYRHMTGQGSRQTKRKQQKEKPKPTSIINNSRTPVLVTATLIGVHKLETKLFQNSRYD